MMQVIRDHEAHETLILEAIVAVCGVEGSVRVGLLEQFADMLVKLNNPPRMMGQQMQAAAAMGPHQRAMEQQQAQSFAAS